MPNKPAVALDAMPDPQELLAAKELNMTLLQYRAAMRNAADLVPVGKTFTILPCTVPEQRYTLPWSALQTGNKFFGLASKAYLAAKERAREIVKLNWPGMLYTVPVLLDVRLYVPNEQRRDVLNYAKLIADVLTGIVYRDDSLIHEAHFTREIDIDRPRAEITVRPR